MADLEVRFLIGRDHELNKSDASVIGRSRPPMLDHGVVPEGGDVRVDKWDYSATCAKQKGTFYFTHVFFLDDDSVFHWAHDVGVKLNQRH